jgi:hypothetical protein
VLTQILLISIRFIYNFEEFYRKLGCSLNPLSSSSKSRSNRSIFRDRQGSSVPKEAKKEELKPGPQKELKGEAEEHSRKAVIPVTTEPVEEEPEAPSDAKKPVPVKPEQDHPRRSRSRLEQRGKKEADESPEKTPNKSPEKPLRTPEKATSKSPEKTAKSPEKATAKTVEKVMVKSPDKVETKAGGKKRRVLLKEKNKETEAPLEFPETPEPPPPPPPTTPPLPPTPSSLPKKGVGRGKYKRKSDKDPIPEPDVEPPVELFVPDHIGKDVKVQVGDKLQVYYGPKSDGKVTYDAKVTFPKCYDLKNLPAKRVVSPGIRNYIRINPEIRQ